MGVPMQVESQEKGGGRNVLQGKEGKIARKEQEKGAKGGRLDKTTLSQDITQSKRLREADDPIHQPAVHRRTLRVQTTEGVENIDLDKLRAELGLEKCASMEHHKQITAPMGGWELIEGAYHYRPTAQVLEKDNLGTQSTSQHPTEENEPHGNMASQPS